MDYMITFSDVMATVITLGLGVIGFFMKRWISDVEQGNKALQQALENRHLLSHMKLCDIFSKFCNLT